jgi:ATP-dependent Zn protease
MFITAKYVFMQVSMIIETQYAHAVQLLEQNKDKLQAFAEELMKRKVGCFTSCCCMQV